MAKVCGRTVTLAASLCRTCWWARAAVAHAQRAVCGRSQASARARRLRRDKSGRDGSRRDGSRRGGSERDCLMCDGLDANCGSRHKGDGLGRDGSGIDGSRHDSLDATTARCDGSTRRLEVRRLGSDGLGAPRECFLLVSFVVI